MNKMARPWNGIVLVTRELLHTLLTCDGWTNRVLNLSTTSLLWARWTLVVPVEQSDKGDIFTFMETLKLLNFCGGVDIELSPTLRTSTLPCRDQQGITKIHLTKQSTNPIKLKALESSLVDRRRASGGGRINTPENNDGMTPPRPVSEFKLYWLNSVSFCRFTLSLV